MAYEIALDRDLDRGMDRYTVTVGEGFDAAHARELGDWLAAAAQNPTAVFRIDVTGAPRASRRPVARLLAAVAGLRARQRVEVVRRPLAARAWVVAPLAAEALAVLG